jgi:hypothetical protein
VAERYGGIIVGITMSRFFRATQIIFFAVFLVSAIPDLRAQSHDDSSSAAAILAQVRHATGGDAWNHVAELRADGTALFDGKTAGTITTIDDLRTGANSVRIEIAGQRVRNYAESPTQDWEQDNDWKPGEPGEVLLTPGGKKPGDIDDLYIHRNGWWQPGFGGATITLHSPATEDGVTYDRLGCKVPGGNGFTLWIDRSTHRIDRIVGGNSVTSFSDFRQTESGLTLPFREQHSNGKNVAVFTTTQLTALPHLNAADL